MYFVNREKEISQIEEAMEEGENVIVAGRYGIGRTSFVRHVAQIMRDQWRFVFVDFSKTPGSVCNYLLAELFPQHECSRNLFMS
jgi:AAA+ ATPase superfamily predicted ATPase